MTRVQCIGLVAVAFVGGCRADITVGGESVRQCQPGTCPEGLRCYDGHCILNTPPVLSPLGQTRAIPIDSEISVTALASDPDADPITFRWSQIAGPSQTFDAVGATVTLTPAQLGLHTFRVEIDDGFIDEGMPLPSTNLHLLVQPSGPGAIVYVAQTDSAADTDCGDIARPCRSIAAALAETSGPTRVLVAVAPQPYVECLNLEADAEVTGGFSPTGWEQFDTGGGLTTVQCDRCEPGEVDCLGCPADGTLCGHHLRGASTLRSIALTSNPMPMPVGVDAIGSTLWLQDDAGAPNVENVDISVADCGGECLASGIFTIGSDATLTGVNVSSPARLTTPPWLVTAMMLVGGAPTVLGELADPRAPAPAGTRGVIELSGSGSAAVAGIVALGSAPTIYAMSVRAGRGISTSGIVLQNTTASLQSNYVGAVGAGTQTIWGVQVQTCEFGADEQVGAFPCLCDDNTYCASQTGGTDLLHDNWIDVSSDLNIFGLQACSAVGLELGTSDVSVDGGGIEVGDGFSTGLGIALTGPNRLPGANEYVHISNVNIRVGDGVFNPVCSLIPSALPLLLPWSAGIATYSGEMGLVINNDVQVGSHSVASYAVAHLSGDSFSYEGNRLIAGASPNLRIGAAVGAALGAGAQSSFTDNLIVVGAQVSASTGLHLWGSGPWLVSNNYIYGGDATHATGLAINPTGCALPGSGLRIVSNTIVAGGLLGQSASTTAISAKVCPESGLLTNNLIDAGIAQGQRVALDLNTKVTGPTKLNLHAEANIYQVMPTSTGPIETPVFVPLQNRDIVLRPRAASVIYVDSGGGAQHPATALNTTPSAYGRGSEGAGNIPLVVAGPGWAGMYHNGPGIQHFSLLQTPDQPLQLALRPRAIAAYEFAAPVIVFEAQWQGAPGLWFLETAAGDDAHATAMQLFVGGEPYALPSTVLLSAAGGRLFVAVGDRLLDTNIITYSLYQRAFEDVTPVGLGTIDVIESRSLAGDTAVSVYLLSEGTFSANLRRSNASDGVALPWQGGKVVSSCAGGPPVCAGAKAISVHAAENGAQERVVVGCDDGFFEVYNVSIDVDGLVLQCANPSRTDSLLGNTLREVTLDTSDVIATADDDPVLHYCTIGGSNRHDVPLITDAAQVENSGGLLGYATISITGIQENFCPIAAHDLVSIDSAQLVEGGGDCVDGGASQWTLDFGGDPADAVVSAPSTDLGGQTRDASPDVGADELDLP